ncbi:MAG: glycosyltransferase family 2 protein [Alphaproteobacteria bacterium]|nr:glycosyltransferase family 2 protein [Alphaproteobacteria bacterium]
MDKIPVSVLVTTLNEEKTIERCLESCRNFGEVIVIDSHSTDKTAEISRDCGARVELYTWDGQYPKKRGWCLENLNITYDWVFWLDADEVLTPEITCEIAEIFKTPLGMVGYFVKGQYVWKGQKLSYGMANNKLVLFNRHKMEFPIVDDLDIDGMGEIEGHYQPVLKKGFEQSGIGQIKEPLLHYAYEDERSWEERHQRYAHWEAEMTRRRAWPQDPVWWREILKKTIRTSFLRPYIMFFYAFIWKQGFRDGQAGLDFAKSRYHYCRMIRRL